MKKINFLTLIFAFFLMLLTLANVRAQEQVPPENQNPNPNQTVRPFKIFEELGLTREQIQQIRRINQTRKPIVQEAQRNWREANRNLDLAIYADTVNDEEVKTLLKTAQFAQSNLLKERSLTEFLIRKVLTPDQLIKFRQLREQLMQRMNNLKNQNNPNTQQPRQLNRLQQRRLQNRPQQPAN
jgi:Spy/CpxP family protein refolding chaperone